MSEENKSEEPIITPDSIVIPRFGGQREALPLPPGSQELVKQYVDFEQIEEGLDVAIETIQRAKRIITGSRKQFMYELMGRAQQHSKDMPKKLPKGSPSTPKPKKEKNVSKKKGKVDAEPDTK